jgi:hypothetical protein
MLAEAAKRYPKTVQWGKLSACGQVLGKMLAEAAKRYPKTVQRQAEAASVRQKWPETVERGAPNLCMHIKWGGNLGDFQGVVTLGVARDPKCIFPYRGEGFLEGSGRKTRLCYPKK